MWLLMLACETDPCSWSHGTWDQVRADRDGVSSDDGRARMVLGPDGFGYAMIGDPTLEPAVLTPVTSTCDELRIEWDGRTFTARETDEGMTLSDRPGRVFVFERAR